MDPQLVELMEAGPRTTRLNWSVNIGGTWPGGVAVVVVTAASLLLGGATSLAQGSIPYPWAPVANSASSWTLVAFLLVRLTRRRRLLSMLLGLFSFAGLVLGHTLVSNLRGYYESPWLFLAVSVMAGPLVGAAAMAFRQSGRWAAAAAGLVAGVLIGDSIHGLTRLLDTTGWAYWGCIGVSGTVIIFVTVARRTPRLPVALVSILATSLVALLLNMAYALL